MKLLKTVRFLVLFALLLTSCNLPFANPPQIEMPTIPAGTMEAMRTEVAETVIAAQPPTLTPAPPTETSLPPTLPPPTETPLPPTATSAGPTPIPPTLTATFLPPPTLTKVPLIAPTFTRSAPAYGCLISRDNPPYRAEYKAGMDFDSVWTITNISTSVWDLDTYTLRFVRGDSFTKNDTSFILPKEVKPNGKVTITVDMTAPKQPGEYTAVFGLAKDSTILCAEAVVITVVK